MTEFGPQEVAAMRRAIELSERGIGRVQPNPLVGAVVLNGDGVIVGEGHHAEYGGPHAEVVAIEQAGSEAAGGTLYVTLEPCAHHGKTPPCTRAIAAAGIRRTVFAAADRDPDAAGGGDDLRRLGVQVSAGLLAEAAARVNAPFHWWQATGEPFVGLKLAVSLDGKISARPGTGSRISSPEAGGRTMVLRSEADAILVGAGTVRVDDPLLTVRGAPAPRVAPARVVVDGNAGLPLESRLVATIEQAPVLVFVGTGSSPSKIQALQSAGVEIEVVPRVAGAGLDIEAVLRNLRDRGIRSILCEGGARLANTLLSGGFVQRLHWHLSPRVLGPRGVPALSRPVGAGWAMSRCSAAGADALIEWEQERLNAVLKGV